MKLRFSKFLSTQERDKTIAIFHRLFPISIYININIWKRIKNNPEKADKDIIKALKERKLIIQSEKEDSGYLEEIRKEYLNKIKQTTTLYLILTHKCNLECKYCFVRRSFNEKERKILMTPEIVKKGIDLWTRHLNNKNDKHFIIFYGGEPLLNIFALKEALEYIKNLQEKSIIPKNTEKIIITNGALINSEIANFLKTYNVEVTVSIDGPMKTHNICRIDKDKKGTFKKVEKAVKILQAKGITPCISATITPYNLAKLKEFPSFLKELKVKEFGLNMLAGKSLSFLNSEMTLEQYINLIPEEIINTFISARKNKIYEDRIGNKIRSFTESNFYPTDCKAYGAQIVIQPNGYVSNCHASSRYNIKHIKNCDKDFKITDINSVKKWEKRLPLFNQDCLNCEAISICGGGCPWSTEEIKGDLMKRDDIFCNYTKRAFEFIIWDFYKE